MAISSSSSPSSLLLPNISFHSTTTRSVSIPGIFLPRNRLRHSHTLPLRIRASRDDNVAVEDRENAVINGNGSVRLNGNGAARKSINGDLNGNVPLNGNGSLVKYVNGSVTEEVSKKRKEEKRQKRVEDIGQEDAWFKKTQQKQQVEVNHHFLKKKVTFFFNPKPFLVLMIPLHEHTGFCCTWWSME